MAKGSISAKPKKEKVHMSKRAVASMNEKNYGPEPEPDHPYTNRDVSIAINWYYLNCDRKQARAFLLSYLEEAGRDSDLKRIKAVSDSRARGFVSDGCWIARMFSRDVEFVDRPKWEAVLNARLQKLYDYLDRGEDELEEGEDGTIKVVAAAPVKAPKVRLTAGRSPREKQFDRYLALLNEVMDAIDITDNGKTDVKYVLTQRLVDEQLDEVYVRDMIHELTDVEHEIVDSLRSGSEFLTRWPDRLNSMRRKRPLVASLLVQLNDYLDTVVKRSKVKVDPEGKPVERKPRKKKPISIEKLVSRVIFKAEDTELGLKSIDVQKIVGAKELWLYNTKYANLTVYRSLTDAGLSVRGTTLLNYDENSSLSKKIGRKAKQYTDGVLATGKVGLRKYMDSITSNPTVPNGRINENTILLRALT